MPQAVIFKDENCILCLEKSLPKAFGQGLRERKYVSGAGFFSLSQWEKNPGRSSAAAIGSRTAGIVTKLRQLQCPAGKQGTRDEFNKMDTYTLL